jgi:hypothetical protein
MCGFVAALCRMYGADTVLAISPHISPHLCRSWLAVELLCQWCAASLPPVLNLKRMQVSTVEVLF